MKILSLIFWILLFFIFYGYFGYPLIIFILSKLFPHPIEKGEIYPCVSLIIPVYNGEKFIQKKLLNCFSLDYPKDKLEIIFVSDGSQDNTVNIIKEQTSEKVKLLDLSIHRGKSYAINQAVKIAKGEIIVLSDVDNILKEDALKKLVSNFLDKKIGCVSGGYRVLDGSNTSEEKGYRTYLDYDIWVKRNESLFYTILGAHGAFYGIRSFLFEPLPENIINEDLYNTLKIISKGYRAVYEDKAIVLDRLTYDLKEELRRRSRISSGNWQIIFMLNKINLPFIVLWQFFSHHILRTIMPLIIIFNFILSIFLKGKLYKIIFLVYVLVFLSGFLGWCFRRNKLKLIFYIPYFFLLGNLGYLLGTFKFFLNKEKARW